MIMARHFWMTVVSALAFSLSAYAADEKAAPVPDAVFPAALEASAKQLAERLASGLAESLKSGDFAAFNAVQPEAAKRKFTADTFAKMNTALERRYGKLVNAEFFGRLDQGKVMDFLWKFSFEKSGDGDKKLHHEILLLVRTGSVKGEAVIAGFSFYFF